MKMKHLLLEVYCDYEECQEQCCYFEEHKSIGLHCFERKCELMSYTYCPHELAYSADEGIVLDLDSFIGFGDEMDADVEMKDYDVIHQKLLKEWETICKDKIAEAYEEYIAKKKDFDNY